MTKSELKEIIRETILTEMEGHSKYYPGGKTPGLTKKVMDTILMNIAKGTDSSEKKPIKEASNIKNIEISYVYPGGKFYGVKVDGKKLPGFDASKEFIKDLTGLDLPTKAYFDDKEVLDIVDAIKAKGIEAGSSEQDVS